MFESLKAYVEERKREFDSIPYERKQFLHEVSAYIRSRCSNQQPARLVFICTHNSRRSQLAQAWSAIASEVYSVPQVECYSGGTEVTEFNPRSVAALRRAGFEITSDSQADNPIYTLAISPEVEFDGYSSKVFDQPPNPRENFAAIMTCTDAEQKCPIVAGSDLRLALPFDDPKSSDGTPEESATYDERSAQIAREMLYVFSRLHEKRGSAAGP